MWDDDFVRERRFDARRCALNSRFKEWCRQSSAIVLISGLRANQARSHTNCAGLHASVEGGVLIVCPFFNFTQLPKMTALLA